jgi:hypothetical protein
MAEAVDDALAIENAVGGDEIIDERLEVGRLRRRAQVPYRQQRERA